MSRRKIGRNEPCPCGNGKKYKHCHGSFLNTRIDSNIVIPRLQTNLVQPVQFRVVPDGVVPPEVAAKAVEIFRDQQQKEQERVAKFGHGRPDIAMDYHGYKFVAIGGWHALGVANTFTLDADHRIRKDFLGGLPFRIWFLKRWGRFLAGALL